MRQMMVLPRFRRALPGSDPLLLYKLAGIFHLCIAAVFILTALENAELAGSFKGHWPWPLAQWALTTPLGTLILAVVGGLIVSAPYIVLIHLGLLISTSQLVDVTDLPLDAWPLSRLVQDGSAGATLSENAWFRPSPQQRARVWWALAGVGLLLLSLAVAAVVVTWYTLSHVPSCANVSCPPSLATQLTTTPIVLGLFLMYLSSVVWTAWVERRCGVRFRVRSANERMRAYIRRPGVTPEAASAALRRYTHATRENHPPEQLAMRFSWLLAVPFAIFCLMAIGATLLSAWLSTQWIPG
jgi:hypothetical protein